MKLIEIKQDSTVVEISREDLRALSDIVSTIKREYEDFPPTMLSYASKEKVEEIDSMIDKLLVKRDGFIK
ncbi:MAG: hypothetical protein AAF135_21420 [Bacteroidota bacterium]